jgi:hypothetical protein
MSFSILVGTYHELIASIPSFSISEDNIKKTWTNEITKFFHEQGDKRGYNCRSKHVNGEHMGLDVVWKKDDGNIVLAVEHENRKIIDRIRRTELLKLVDVKSTNKILICYPGKDLNIILEDFRTLIMANKYAEKEYYLLMMGNQPIRKAVQDRVIEYKCYILDNNGKQIWDRDSRQIPILLE